MITEQELDEYVAIVKAEERERCAQLLDEVTDINYEEEMLLESLAKEIRKLK